MKRRAGLSSGTRGSTLREPASTRRGQQLKEALARNSIPLPEAEKKQVAEKLCLPAATPEIANIVPPSDKEAKVALFRSLFRGREDVYADRWRMKDGKWGIPTCQQERLAGRAGVQAEDYKKVDRQTPRIVSPD